MGTNAEIIAAPWDPKSDPVNADDAMLDIISGRPVLSYPCVRERGRITVFDPELVPRDWNGPGCHFETSRLCDSDRKHTEETTQRRSKWYHVRSYDPKGSLDSAL